MAVVDVKEGVSSLPDNLLTRDKTGVDAGTVDDVAVDDDVADVDVGREGRAELEEGCDSVDVDTDVDTDDDTDDDTDIGGGCSNDDEFVNVVAAVLVLSSCSFIRR